MSFDENIEKAIYLIKSKKYDEALTCIHLAMLQNDISAKPHNLLGIICEINGDLDSALKHYNVAYSLDATFKSAYKNLERISSFNYVFNFNDLYYEDFKDNTADKNLYTLEYTNNIGHLVLK